MGWDGTMQIRDDVAAHLARSPRRDRADKQHAGGLFRGDPARTHPFHDIGRSREYGSQDNIRTYQRKTPMMIEEGFTELGSTQHAADFFDALGVGDRPTPVLAVKDGHPVEDAQGNLVKATMREWAQRLADPQRIAAGESWGHYPQYVAAAQKWTQQVASLEGLRGKAAAARSVELADEVNRAGPAGKAEVLAGGLRRQGTATTPAGHAGGRGHRPGNRRRAAVSARGDGDLHELGSGKSIRGKSFNEALKTIRPWMPSKVRYT